MRFVLLFFSIICLLFLNAFDYLPTYSINIDNYLYTNSPYNYPYISVYCDALIDTSVYAQFYSSLIDFEPVNFYLKFANTNSKSGFLYKTVFGDNVLYSPVRIRARGFFGSLFYEHVGFTLFSGKEFTPYLNREFSQNRGLYLVSMPVNVSYNDTTAFFFANRFDNPVYTPYISQQVIGIRHNSVLFNTLFSDFTIRRSSNLLYYNDYKTDISSDGRMQFRTSRFSLTFSGYYIPQYSSGFSGMIYKTGRNMIRIEPVFRITNELSLTSSYTRYRNIPNDTLSYDSYSGRIGTAIGFFPRVSFMFEKSVYFITGDFRHQNFGINTGKNYGGFGFDLSYVNLRTEFETRHEIYSFANYRFYNGAVIGSNARFSMIDTSLVYSASQYIKWNIKKIWTYDYGIDFGDRGRSTYIGNHFNVILNIKNISLTNNMLFYYDRSFSFSMATKLNVSDNLQAINFGRISGRIYYDKNNNGIFDMTDSPVSNIEVSLNDSIKTKTGKSGGFSFSFLKPAKYKMSVSKNKLAAYYDSKGYVIVDVSNFNKTFIEMPLVKLGSISGFVFYDTNKNGIIDNNEVGIPGIVVRIKDSETYTYTDNNGFYSISNLPNGNYIVEVPYLPPEHLFVFPNLIMYIAVDKIKSDFTVDFGVVKESKPVRKKIF